MCMTISQLFILRWSRKVFKESNKYRNISHYKPNTIMTYDDKLFKNKPKSDKKSGNRNEKFPTPNDFTMFAVIASIGALIYNK